MTALQFLYDTVVSSDLAAQREEHNDARSAPVTSLPRITPSPEDAARILTEVMGEQVAQVERFTTGLAHFVYDARLVDGRQFVVRLTRPMQAPEFAGALYWYKHLKPLGIPLPELHYQDVQGTRHGFPVMILERLAGTDLWHVYDRLSDGQKREISAWVVDLQRRAATLPHATGFGYATSYDDPALLPTWRDVLRDGLARSRRRIESAGVVDVEVVDRVATRLDDFDAYLQQIEPAPFLHDTTTKNVIIDADGHPTGIVDVDSLCFGDPLWTVALTRMALLAHRFDTAYIDHWEHHLALTPTQRRASLLYTALHCAAFLSELGQAFNNETAPPVDAEYQGHLLAVLDGLFDSVQ